MKLTYTFSDADRNLAKLIVVTPIAILISSLYIITIALDLEVLFNTDVFSGYTWLVILIILYKAVLIICYFVLTDYFVDTEDEESKITESCRAGE